MEGVVSFGGVEESHHVAFVLRLQRLVAGLGIMPFGDLEFVALLVSERVLYYTV